MKAQQIQLVEVRVNRSHYLTPDQYVSDLFWQRVKEGETPLQAAENRARELYPYDFVSLASVKLRTELENEDCICTLLKVETIL